MSVTSGIEAVGFRIEKAINAGEKDDSFRADEFRHADGEHVVVAEVQFANCNGVVFVDDGRMRGFSWRRVRVLVI